MKTSSFSLRVMRRVSTDSHRTSVFSEYVDYDARAGRPSTSRIDENIQRVHDLVKTNCRITTRMIAEKLGISNGSVQTIFKEDLNTPKLCTKIVPKVSLKLRGSFWPKAISLPWITLPIIT
ncbi:hypothetical protein ALC62_03769 [Cyphomyrmex costatus]|uniref:Histone-lysine N-methyltransferase SETMAR n=1 Tax=Cyphomyrmex costatus TaxID=456900 RepID=A0A151ILE7_9HYME|nr:hypothetical protein ALC62_03769 [Cyphomyrmex costatus]